MIWFGLVLWYINHCRLFNAKSCLYIYIKYIWFGLVWFYGISTIVGYLIQSPFLNIQRVLLQTIQFSISTLFSSIWPVDRTLSGATTLGQSGPGSNGNKVVLCIHLSSSFTGASPSDCLVSYPGHTLKESYSSAEMQVVYSATPANCVKRLY